MTRTESLAASVLVSAICLAVASCVTAGDRTDASRVEKGDERKIEQLVADLWDSINSGDVKRLKMISPPMRILRRKGGLDQFFSAMQAQWKQANEEGLDLSSVVQVEIDEEKADALAFCARPGENENAAWYYLRKQEEGWTIWIYEDWPVSTIPRLFERCRNTVDKALAPEVRTGRG